jgi:dissimilatory sulfite reductase (desulfoviridin) alpha/beta subunit
MKIGDKVKISDRNRNHLDSGVDAYAGMEGVVTNIYDDNAFCLDCGDCTLAVPMNNAFKQRIEGIWIWLNGELIFHRSKKLINSNVKPTKKWFHWFIPQSFLQ